MLPNLRIAICGVLFFIILTSCGGDSGKQDIAETASVAVSDSLRTGKLAGANSLIDTRMAEASDSDTYYAWLTQRAVVGYYSAQPDSILSASSRVLTYLNRQEETPLRLKIRSKAAQARAGYYNQFVFNADSALFYQQMGYNAAHASGDREQTQVALANLADCHRVAGRLDVAADAYREAVALGDSLKLSDYGMLPVYSGLAATYTALHAFDQSDIWWNRVDSIYDRMAPSEKFYYLNNRGNDLYLAEKYDKSLSYFKRLESMLKDNPEMEWERHFCLANISDVLIKLNRAEEAKDYISDNLKFFSEIQPNEYVYNHVLIQQMELLRSEGRDAEVVSLLRLHPMDKKVRPDQYYDRYQFLKDFYPDIGQWERAYNSLHTFRMIDDSLRNDRRRLSASEQELRYRRDSEVKDLKLNIEHQNKRMIWIYVGFAGAILLAAILVLFMIVMKRNARLREERMLNRIMRLRIDTLRTGVTPHFIYNALNQELYAREHNLPGNLDNLSSLLRRQQLMAGSLTSTLAEELNFTDDYVSVESPKVKAGLIYKKEIADDIDINSLSLPSMSIQILVENAFKHGLLHIPEGAEALLLIRAEKSGDCVKVSVCNTLPDSAPTDIPSTKVGLKVIMATMQLLNEHNRRKMNLHVGSRELAPGVKGYEATITIPLNFNYDLNGNDN